MKIKLDINKTLKDCIKTNRMDVYVWKDLDHLKSYYAEAIDGETIDKIADEIRKDKESFKDRIYGDGENLETHLNLNERCLCNLVEMKLISQSNKALDHFFKKPL